MSLVTIKDQYSLLSSFDEKLAFIRTLNKQAEFEKALDLYIKLKDESIQANQVEIALNCYAGICQNLSNLGRITEMAPYIYDYKKYCNKYGNISDKVKLHGVMGYVSGTIEDHASAIYHYKQALQYAKQLDDSKHVTYLLVNLQSTYLDMHDLTNAEAMTEKIKVMLSIESLQIPKMTYCGYLLNYMTLLMEKKEVEQLPTIFKEVEEIEDFEKMKRVQMYLSYLKGQYYEFYHKQERAILMYEEAFVYLQLTHEAPYYKKVLKRLMFNYKYIGNYEKSTYFGELLVEELESDQQAILQEKTLELSRKLKLHEMQEQIYYDSLTDIHNRRYLEVEGENWLNYAQQTNTEIACCMIDLDNFKWINDQYGHLFGDVAIKRFAKSIQNQMDENSFCIRYGGDEFIVLARNHDNFETLFRTIFHTLQGMYVTNGKQDVLLELSMGVFVARGKEIESVEQLIGKADKALYEVKNYGKNNLSIRMK